MAEYGGLQLALMSADDRSNIEHARTRGFVFPSYRCTTIDHMGAPHVYEALFTPAQFRAVTIEPFPECATLRNCRHLLHVWNKASTDKPRHYELVQAPEK